MDLRNESWSCAVCGRARPDAVIGVAYRPMVDHVDDFPNLRWNITYCKDTAECVEWAEAPGPWEGPPPRQPAAT